MPFHVAVVAVLIAITSTVAVAADPLVGKQMFWKPDAKVKLQDEDVEVFELSFPDTVTSMDGDLLRFGRLSVRRSDMMLPEEALQYYSELTSTDNSPTLFSWNNRAAVLCFMGDYDKGIEDFTKVIQRRPKHPVAYGNRGEAWLKKGDFDACINDCTAAIRINPEFPAAYSNRGEAWTKKAQYEKAITDFKDALQLNATHAHSHRGLAWILATCPDDRFRDGKTAVNLAKRACRSTRWKEWESIRSYTAACAETEDFATAVEWQLKAIALATADADKDALKKQLDFYKAGKPFRDRQLQ